MTLGIGPIQWPAGIDECIFLDKFWQKKPLLIQQAFPDFITPLPADELAGLSLEPDTTGRIITRDGNGAYALEHGPFAENRFASLTDNQWSLLVTDVEKHIPEFTAYLQPFRFIPDWRIDDLMISYAPDGASVGAHVDEYDVFLLQGSGVRTWRIDARNDTAHQLRTDGDLKILANFQPTDEWDLAAGDMLYLPPGMAHHGIAKGDECTTWSIGFRAPRLPDFIARMAELISEQLAPQVRYTDGPLTPSRQGEISRESIQRFKAIWDQATKLGADEFSTLLGSWLTESTALDPSVTSTASTPKPVISDDTTVLQKNPFSRFAWTVQSDATTTNGATTGAAVTLFADGTAIPCSQNFALSVCNAQQWVDFAPPELIEIDQTALQILIDMGCLLPPDHDARR